MKPIPKNRIIIGFDNQEISLGKMKLRIVNSPGHASHHSCFIEEKSRLLFAGEAAGTYLDEIGLMRPATPFPFNLNYALKTLDRLIQLDPSSLCYGHFGFGKKAVDRLKQHKQQLILWAETISAKRHLTHEKILEALLEQDKNLNRIEELISSINEREKYYLFNSINGFARYFEKYGEYSL
jgi:glyoxylase-like metal-dependent hydrolase (beta-lactamase superfamily II)